MERQRQQLTAELLGGGAVGVAHVVERFLAGNGHWVMDQGFDAGRREMRPKRVTLAAADDEQMIHVSGVALRRDLNRSVGQQSAIKRGELTPPPGGGAKS